jgi:isoleucyl-tRNA synthetase
MSLFPAAEDFENALDASRSAAWDRLLAVRGEVLKALEPVRAAKTISGGLEARVTLAATGELLDLLRKYSAYLPALFIVSQVEIAASPIQGTAPAATLEGLQIRIERALGKKCERCWNYSTHVGESAEYPTLCERCLAALDEIDRDSGVTSGSAKV